MNKQMHTYSHEQSRKFSSVAQLCPTLCNLMDCSTPRFPVHYQLNRHEFEQAPGVGDGRGSLACCSPWGRKESGRTEDWTDWWRLFSSVCTEDLPIKHSLICWCLVVSNSLVESDPMDCNPPGSSLHGIFQARILQCVAVSFSRDLPDPGI